MTITTNLEEIRSGFAAAVDAIAHCEIKSVHMIEDYPATVPHTTKLLMEIDHDNATGLYRMKRTTHNEYGVWFKPRLGPYRNWLAVGIVVGDLPIKNCKAGWFHVGLDRVELTAASWGGKVTYVVNPYQGGTVPQFRQAPVPVIPHMPAAAKPAPPVSAEIVSAWAEYLMEANALCSIVEMMGAERFLQDGVMGRTFERWIKTADPNDTLNRAQRM